MDDAAAAAEAARLLGLYKVHRDRYRFPVAGEYAAARDLADEVRLIMGRFGLEAGRNFRLIGLDEKAGDNKTILDIWG